jgi:hypothetical protein
MNATVPAVLIKRDIRRETLAQLESMMDLLFNSSPNLPNIRREPGVDYIHLDEVYRQYLYFLHVWTLSTQRYLLQHSEIRTVFLRVAERHGKITTRQITKPR